MGGNCLHRSWSGYRERATVCRASGSRLTVVGSIAYSAAFGLTSDSDYGCGVVKTDNRCSTHDVYLTFTYIGIDHSILNGYSFNWFSSQIL